MAGKLSLDEFQKLLSHFTAEHIAVCVPEGNNGDKLICLGLEKFLRNTGLFYSKFQSSAVRFSTETGDSNSLSKIACITKKSIEKLNDFTQFTSVLSDSINRINHLIAEPQFFPRNMAPVILINGGGNINDFYAAGRSFVLKILEANPNSEIIIAPETFYFSKKSPFISVLARSSQKIHIFCRERYSYSLMTSFKLPSNFHVYLSPDTAFYLSAVDFVKKGLVSPCTGRIYDLVCLRTDKEAVISRVTLTKKIQRQSAIIKDISEFASFQEYVSSVMWARKIYTDRLHVAILGHILGKDVYLFPNVYYKNKAVFEYSLIDNPRVSFVSRPEADSFRL